MTVRAEELWEGRDTHVILGGATDVAAFALDALPAVGLHCCHHHWGELQARRMPCGGRGASKTGAGNGGERGDLDNDKREPLGAGVLAGAALARGST